MISAMVCGSIMKIKAFDFRPDIIIKIDSVEDEVELRQDVFISAENDYTHRNDSFKLSIFIMNSDPRDSISIFWRAIFITGFSFLTLLLIMTSKKQSSKR